MANTGEIQVIIATVEPGTTAVSANRTNTGVAFTPCFEAVLTIVCSAVSSAGIMVPALWGSTDGGANYAELTATTGSALTAVSATGTQTYRYKQLPGHVQMRWTKTSGTSITATAVLTGLVPVDSANATAV